MSKSIHNDPSLIVTTSAVNPGIIIKYNKNHKGSNVTSYIIAGNIATPISTVNTINAAEKACIYFLTLNPRLL